MQVLYVDIYFLINFTVDLIALFFTMRILHIKAEIWRLVLISFLGGIFAIADILLQKELAFGVMNGLIYIALTAILLGKSLTALRRIKGVALYIAFEVAIGGIVYFVYGILDTHFSDIESFLSFGDENRSALVFSLIILIVIGVLKMFVLIFGNQMGECSKRVRITVSDRKLELDAFVDSGNLVRDPMNMKPVIFMKKEAAVGLLPTEVIELEGLDALTLDIKRRIRLIPVSSGKETHVMTGYIPDSVELFEKGSWNSADVTLVIDKEEGNYGGYSVLIPSTI